VAQIDRAAQYPLHAGKKTRRHSFGNGKSLNGLLSAGSPPGR
jgi:hypothetical protein